MLLSWRRTIWKFIGRRWHRWQSDDSLLTQIPYNNRCFIDQIIHVDRWQQNNWRRSFVKFYWRYAQVYFNPPFLYFTCSIIFNCSISIAIHLQTQNKWKNPCEVHKRKRKAISCCIDPSLCWRFYFSSLKIYARIESIYSIFFFSHFIRSIDTKQRKLLRVQWEENEMKRQKNCSKLKLDEEKDEENCSAEWFFTMDFSFVHFFISFDSFSFSRIEMKAFSSWFRGKVHRWKRVVYDRRLVFTEHPSVKAEKSINFLWRAIC